MLFEGLNEQVKNYLKMNINRLFLSIFALMVAMFMNMDAYAESVPIRISLNADNLEWVEWGGNADKTMAWGRKIKTIDGPEITITHTNNNMAFWNGTDLQFYALVGSSHPQNYVIAVEEGYEILEVGCDFIVGTNPLVTPSTAEYGVSLSINGEEAVVSTVSKADYEAGTGTPSHAEAKDISEDGNVTEVSLSVDFVADEALNGQNNSLFVNSLNLYVIIKSIDKYLVSFIVDEEVIRTYYVTEGNVITRIEEPTKEGYTFSGWSEIPATMPAHDVTITGSFIVNPTYETEDAVLAYVEDKGGYEFTGTKEPDIKEVTLPKDVNGIPIVSVPEGTFTFNTQMQVLTWNCEAPIDANCFDEPEEHGNLLVFVPSDTARVTYKGNVVRNGVAEKVTLYDGRPLINPISFIAQHISITKEFNKKTFIGRTGGWETIVLPFDVDSITTEDGRLIVPFGSNAHTSRHFWLARMDADDGFIRVSNIRANVPYIISMPNSERYIEEHRISGKVTFHGTNVEVQPTTNATSNAGPLFGLVPTYQEVAAADTVFVLNDEQYEVDGITWPAGSVFVRLSRAARPFEAYTCANASNGGNVKEYIPIDDLANGIQRPTSDPSHNGGDAGMMYDLSGRQIVGSEALNKGLYIKDGQKVLVK